MLRALNKSGRLAPTFRLISKRFNTTLSSQTENLDISKDQYPSDIHTQELPSIRLTKPKSLAKDYIRELKILSEDKPAYSRRTVNATGRDHTVTGDTYSSGNDNIYREKNTDDVLRLWSLLDVCLNTEKYDRALAILRTLKPLVVEDRLPFVDDLNKYLGQWAPKATDMNEIKEFVDTWEREFETLPNGRTFAILANSALTKDASPKDFLDSYLQSGGDLRNVFCHIDALGVQNLTRLIKEFGYNAEDVPEDYRYLVTEPQTSEVQEDNLIFDENEKSVDNGAQSLVSVDSFGIKVIKNTLIGLKPHLNKGIYDKLDQDLMDKINLTTSDQSHTTTNFFEIYKSLPEEEQQKFEEALDGFNVGRQQHLERRTIQASQEKWRHDYEELQKNGSMSLSKNLNATLWKWYSAMLPVVQEEIEKCKKINEVDVKKLSKAARSEHNERAKLADYLLILNAEKAVSITILELLKLNSTGGVSEGMRTARACVNVGNSLELELRSEQLLKTEHQVFKDAKNNKSDLKKYARLLKNISSSQTNEHLYAWPAEIKTKIGSLMISMILNHAKVQVKGIDPVTKKTIVGEAPAFHHSYQYQSNVKVGILKLHSQIASQLSVDSLIGTVQPQFLPMLTKPKEWQAWNNGGYMYTQSFLIRSKDAPEQMAYLKASSDHVQGVYDGLNVLGNTAWTINKRIYEVMCHFWNRKDGFLDIPPVAEDMVLPTRPDSNSDPSVLHEWRQSVKEARTNYNNNISTRCDANYKLEIARAFIGEKMYFPHNLDFRGRAYPLSPNFNHLGNDLSRGLLIFWKGKPLGAKGLDWLKIHVSNLFGIDKAPLHERIQYVNDNLDKVFKTADDPIGYQDWWVTADKPWQALASVMELAEALRSPEPEKFISHQPVHQDGTCNGLQHYAALGGDVEGATQVNLVPGDRPADVYSYVAGLVIKRLEKEAEKGDEVAKVLKDKIKRKVVKQTVMTNVYGVTYIGATAQINKQLSDVFPGEDTYQYSLYLTKHVFACIRELFHGAHLIQDWLAICAKYISKSIRIDLDPKQIVQQGEVPPHMASVIWTTPLGLPIVQPYRSVSRRQVATNLQTIYISDPFVITPVDSRKQMAAFPPNYIHSLDATHMLLSAVACGKAGLDFASVHDSYWTHAGDIDVMNECLREEFIKLHQVDLIEKLKLEFDERYKGFLQELKIPRSSAVAVEILKKRKELSEQLGRKVNLGDEIFLEKRRQSLLNSENPEDVKLGEEMVTTVSIIEKEDFEKLQVQKSRRRPKKKKEQQQQEAITSRETEVEESSEIDSESPIELEQLEVEEEEEEENTRSRSSIVVLAPLRLPPIPPKGDFDVQELRHSKYFFS
ncbi:hypothetical protein WICPIJ_008881 [Wickerhamomyces pijperi]|uniref:DNA-directed RNA polymerase n=1 Tax=Wickerhamomyces pijperi TaxID=599730 RepID=A0A9P8TH74_WICPI|nr:hypothetical protein WICPIJ_008881 [Wickerhamomyces pijperi]